MMVVENVEKSHADWELYSVIHGGAVAAFEIRVDRFNIKTTRWGL